MNLRPNRKESPTLDMTPLIDVVFLLLIFFMVSTTFEKESRIKLNLPEAATEERPQEKVEKIEISIDARGGYYLNGAELINRSRETLRAAIEKAAAGRRDLPLIIAADAQTPHQAVITVMDVASRLGLVNMSFPTRLDAEGE